MGEAKNMKLKKLVVSILILTLLLSVFLSVGATALADDSAPQEAAALSYNSYEDEAEETAQSNSVWLYVVAGCTVLLAVFGVLSVNCQKIYDSEK